MGWNAVATGEIAPGATAAFVAPATKGSSRGGTKGLPARVPPAGLSDGPAPTRGGGANGVGDMLAARLTR
jgi:hypothetical protein